MGGAGRKFKLSKGWSFLSGSGILIHPAYHASSLESYHREAGTCGGHPMRKQGRQFRVEGWGLTTVNPKSYTLNPKAPKRMQHRNFQQEQGNDFSVYVARLFCLRSMAPLHGEGGS